MHHKYILILIGYLICAGSCADGIPGQFNYYSLNLTWSPQFCSTHTESSNTARQCGPSQKYGFILHGLWPEYMNGWPEFCMAAPEDVPKSLREDMIDVTPNYQLIEHEWDKHGKCSGMTVETYFSTSKTLYQSLKIPGWLIDGSARDITRKRLIDGFVAENPGMSADSIAIICDDRMLSEVRFCFSREFKPQTCADSVKRRQCKRQDISVLPIQ